MTTHIVTIANRNNLQIAVNGRRPLLEQLRGITCAAKLTKGSVDQRRQVALNNRQINDGYVILCVARATSDITLEIGVESHDKLYRNPFLDPLEPHELKADIATPKEV